MVEISIIVVTYNSASCIENCLDSVYRQGFQDYEIIVVDNCSQDKTLPIIKNKYPNVSLIENTQNYGACRARNQGILKAGGKFVLFLDHDIKLRDNFLENIYKAIENQEAIAGAGPKILLENGEDIYSIGIHPSFLWRFYDIASGRRSDSVFDEGRRVFGVSAAASIYRKVALETIRQGKEYFDEDFFYFLEDVDLSLRLQKKGWGILYVPEAICLHEGGRSRNKDRVSQYLCMRNRYLLIMKNESLLCLPRLFIVFFIYDLWRNLFMLVINPRYFFKAALELIKLSPRMLKKIQEEDN